MLTALMLTEFLKIRQCLPKRKSLVNVLSYWELDE